LKFFHHFLRAIGHFLNETIAKYTEHQTAEDVSGQSSELDVSDQINEVVREIQVGSE
tara:strand:- start:572 stop:742 length:171 start_codon:yes stop_codon:yes gene_type:complete